MLIECDPSIKAIIVKINQEMSNAYIIEDLDDGHLVIKENMVNDLKYRLDDVRSFSRKIVRLELTYGQALKNTQEKVPDSDEERD